MQINPILYQYQADKFPDIAKDYYEKFVEILKKSGLNVKTGVFGADMKVGLINDGPVTIIL